jgi:hypothetical protein
MTIKRINIWSSPRNISTAFMYSFAQRPDTTVIDEPLYAHYLTHQKTLAEHPGREEVLASMEQDGNKVIQNVILGSYDTPIVLFKQMTHHLIAIDRSFLHAAENVLLIREPSRIIHSFAKVIPNPTVEDVGVEMQLALMLELKAMNKLTAIVDSQRLLKNPEHILKQLCARLDIPFYEQMLTWEAGSRPEDGVWAKYWYHKVHQSKGFEPYVETPVVLSPALTALSEACTDYYKQLLDHALE